MKANRKMQYKLHVLGLFLLMAAAASCKTPPSDSLVTLPGADLLIQDALTEDLFTGAVLLVSKENEIVHHKSYGFATLYDENLRVVDSPDSTTTQHLFDLASLTKIFATTYGIMALHSDGLIDLEHSIGIYLPSFDTPKHRAITIRHLLNHTSGLVQWYPSYYRASNAAERRKVTAELPLESEPGKSRRYSDFGFMLLADVIEKVSGRPFEEYLNGRIYSRIGLQKTVFNPLEKSFEKIASTSHGNPFERRMVYDPNFGYRIDIDPESWNGWRTYTLKGEVNDGNAWYANEGIAGHAGLFSTAEELSKLVKTVLNKGMYNNNKIFEQETIRLFTMPDEFENGLGWAMQPSVIQTDSISAGAIGHTGFTGTNILAKPNENGGGYYILLTNRQHVGVDQNGRYPDLSDLRVQISNFLFFD